MRLNGMRYLTKQLRGRAARQPRPVVNKLHRAKLEIELGEIGVEIQGERRALALKGSPTRSDGQGGSWQQLAVWPEVVIGGGTPNIQRNIIAERILGLPKD